MAQAQAAPARARILASLRGPTAITTLTNLAILGANALAGIVSARALGPVGRGQLAVVMLWSGLISMVGMLGPPSSVWRLRGALAGAQHHTGRLLPAGRHPAGSRHDRGQRTRPLVAALPAAFADNPDHRIHERGAGTAIALYGTCFLQGQGDFTRFNVMRATAGGLAAAPMLVIALMVHLTSAEAGSNTS